jgi:hypothetical protein
LDAIDMNRDPGRRVKRPGKTDGRDEHADRPDFQREKAGARTVMWLDCVHGLSGSSVVKKRMFFFEKKNQKTFVRWRAGPGERTRQ